MTPPTCVHPSYRAFMLAAAALVLHAEQLHEPERAYSIFWRKWRILVEDVQPSVDVWVSGRRAARETLRELQRYLSIPVATPSQ